MNALDIGRILLGLVLLVGGGELLVRGASALATRIGISSLVVGLTVVSAATSAPELAVSLGAVLDGETDLAVGNVVGSNIINVLLILGIAAIVLPLAVQGQLVRIDVPVMIGLSALLLVLSLDGGISTADGVVLLGLVIAHSTYAVIAGRRAERRNRERYGTPKDEHGPKQTGMPAAIALVAGGVALLVLGARLLVDGAVSIAASLGVSGLVVGLTVVAIGTSLPELAASVIAAIRGQRDLAVGNVVGSCIFNIGIVLGLPAILSTGGLPVARAAVALDIPLMVATAVVLAPVVFTGFTVGRWEGMLFVALYIAYTAFVVLNATGHDALEGFTTAMMLFVLPLVLLGLGTAVAFEVRRRRDRKVHGLSADPVPPS